MIKKVILKYKSLSIQVKASLWFLICAFLQKGIGFITTPIFTRLMNTAEYGEYNVFISWMGIIEVFVTLKISSGSYIQGLVKFEDKRKEYSSSLLGLTTVLITVWTVIYLFTSDFWNGLLKLNTTQMLLMMILLLMNATMSFWATQQRVDYKYIKLVIITIIGSVLTAVLGIIFVYGANDKSTARVLSTVVADVLVYGVLFFLIFYEGKKIYHKGFWKYILRLNIPLIPHYLAGNILNTADRIMIRDIVGESQAGIYSLAYSVSLIMTVFNQAIVQTLEPWIYKRIKMKEYSSLEKAINPFLVCVAGLNIILILFAPEAIRLFAPAEYYEAIYVVPPIAMGVFFQFMYTFFAPFEFYYEKTRYITIATFVGAVVNIGLNVIFINLFGYIAAGYTTLICYILFAAMHYMFMRKICKDSLNCITVYNKKKLVIVSLLFLGIGILILCTYQSTLLRYCVAVAFVFLMMIKKNELVSVFKSLMQIRGENKDKQNDQCH